MSIERVWCLLPLLAASSAKVLDGLADAPTFPATGDAGCPCVDVQQHMQAHAPEVLNASVPAAACQSWSDFSGVCLGVAYGSSCSAWDDQSAQSVVSSTCSNVLPLPAWCKASFCYVDRDGCWSKPHSPVTYFYNDKRVPAHARLDYSYHTCGFSDKYEAPNAMNLLRNLTLRVTAPEIANPTPAFWREDASGTVVKDGEVWRGPAWQMISALSDTYGFTIQRQRLSQNSIDNSGISNTWYGCVQAIAINETDLCIGDFWAQQDRRAIMAPYGSFTTPFDYAELLLVVPSSAEQPTFGQSSLAFINAAEWSVWGFILLIAIIMTVIYATSERIYLRRHQEFDMSSSDKVEVWEDMFLATVTAPLSTNHTPRGTGGRLVNFGCVIFTLVAATFWSSAVISQMVSTALASGDGEMTLLKAQTDGSLICSQGSVGRNLAAGTLEPAPSAQWSKSGVKRLMVLDGTARGGFGFSATGSLDAMDAGHCKVAVIERRQLQAAMSKAEGKHCNKGVVGSSVITPFEVAFPVRNDIEPALSYMIRLYAGAEMYSASMRRQSEWPEYCPLDISARISNSTELTTVKVENLAFAGLIAVGIGVAGVIFSAVEPAGRRFKKHLSTRGLSPMSRSKARNLGDSDTIAPTAPAQLSGQVPHVA